MAKQLYSYENVHQRIAEASAAIIEWRPTLILAIGGGGYIPARVLRTFVKPECPGLRMMAIGLSLYESDVDACAPGTRVVKTQWLSYGEEAGGSSQSLSGQRILIVDEVDDTRRSLAFAVAELQKDVAAQRARWQQKHQQGGGGGRVASPTTPGVLTPDAGSPPDSPMAEDAAAADTAVNNNATSTTAATAAAIGDQWVEPQFAVFVVHDKDKPKSAQLPAGVEYFCGERVPGDAWIVYPWDAYDAHAHAEQAKAATAAAQAKAAVC